jgi:uncharacterized protein YxjI
MTIIQYLKNLWNEFITVEVYKPVKKVDRSKFTADQLEQIKMTGELWQHEKALFATQDAFAKEINTRFNTNRSTTTIVKYARSK